MNDLDKRLLVCMIMLLCINFFLSVDRATAEDGNLKKLFEEKYIEWKKHVKDNPLEDLPTANKEFAEIVKLGVPALPYIIDAMERNDDIYLANAVLVITWKTFDETDSPDAVSPDLRIMRKLYISWWKSRRGKCSEKFKELYNKWRETKNIGNARLSEEIYMRLEGLGVESLPYIIEKIKSGDSELIPMISFLTRNEIPKTATPEDVIKWWAKDNKKWSLPE
jgi:hypothetical protein